MHLPILKSPHITLDLWDTILHRRCHPDEVKLHTAQNMLLCMQPYVRDNNVSTMDLLLQRQKIEADIGTNCKTNGFDDEYKIEDVLIRCIQNHADTTIPEHIAFSLSSHLIKKEVEHEISITTLNKDLIQLLHSCEYEQLHIISDFYMPEDQINSILLSHAFPFSLDTVFISCDSKLNKRSGRLFEHVISVLNTKPESILHIGDNIEVDVNMARHLNMQAYHFVDKKGDTVSKRNNVSFARRQSIQHSPSLFLSKKPIDALSIRRNLAMEQKRIHAYGIYLSAIFVGFSLFIQERCHTTGHELVHFFTREGIFFKEVFDLVQPHQLYDLPKIQSTLLPVSRLATFFPSLHDMIPQEFMRMWTMYPTQSINSFLKSLGENPHDYVALIQKFNINLEEMFHKPWQNESFLKLLNDKDFLSLLRNRKEKKLKDLLQFFAMQNFHVNGKAMIVDIGWRGTIQDNIAHIFPNLQIDGCYLGLQDYYNPQPANVKKHAYIADRNKNEHHFMLRYVMPLEMLCFGTGGSAVGYKQRKSGEMEADFQCDPEEDRIHNERIHHFQEGVKQGVRQICQAVHEHGISFKELQTEARLLSSDFLHNPPLEMCRAFSALKQDDTFGMARTIFPQEQGFRLSDRLLTYFSKNRRQRLLTDLDTSGWPQATIRTNYFGIFHLLQRAKSKLSKNR